MSEMKEKKLPPIFKKNDRKKEEISKALDNITRDDDQDEELESLDYPFSPHTD